MGACVSTTREKTGVAQWRPEPERKHELEPVQEYHILNFRPVIRAGPEEKHGVRGGTEPSARSAGGDRGAEIRRVFGI